MAKRKGGSSRAAGNKARKRTPARRSAKRPTAKARSAGKAGGRAKPPKARVRKRAAATSRPARPQARSANPAKTPRLNRARRTLTDDIVPTPPSSLNMDRHGSAARTGRAEYAENVREHHGMNEMSAGDADVDVEDAFFTGEEAPGGDNPT